MPSMTLPVRTRFVLTWTLTDTQGNPINTANVVATLYVGRSLRDPNAIPGTAVPPINAVALTYVVGSAGIYSAAIPGTLDPSLDGTGYILVVDGTQSGSPIYHAEQPVVVETAGALIDLTTVDAVKQRAEMSGTNDDNEIQAAITGFSRCLLNRSGKSTLNSIASLDEIYDGNGNQRMFLRSNPILTITNVLMNGASIPLSTGSNQWGVYIEQSKKSIGLRGGIGNFTTFPYPNLSTFVRNRGLVFNYGQGNIEVIYTAGYNDTPEDLEYAVRCVVAINYKRKAWQDQESRGVSSQGVSTTTRYRDWDWPPEYETVFDYYTRKSFI